MRFNRSILVSSMTLAGAMPLLIAGCGNRQDEQPASPAKAAVGMEIDDTAVTTKVKAALLEDPEIRSFDLKVETRKGTVQLSGVVDNQAQIDRAIGATRAVAGVGSVENGIGVKQESAAVGNTVDDGDTTTKVKSALLADPDVRSFDIAVVTRKGEVQLSGSVDSQAQMDQAVAVSRNVDGVTGVTNEMSIKK